VRGASGSTAGNGAVGAGGRQQTQPATGHEEEGRAEVGGRGAGAERATRKRSAVAPPEEEAVPTKRGRAGVPATPSGGSNGKQRAAGETRTRIQPARARGSVAPAGSRRGTAARRTGPLETDSDS